MPEAYDSITPFAYRSDNSVAFAPDRRTLATAGGTVILWDLSKPAQPRPLGQPLTGHSSNVRSVAFAPDRRTLATAGGTVILWDLSDPAQPRPLGQPLGGDRMGVSSVAFSPDGRTLATVGFSGGSSKVVLWDLTELQDLRDHATARACSITKDGLDRDDWARFVTGLPFQSTCPR